MDLKQKRLLFSYLILLSLTGFLLIFILFSSLQTGKSFLIISLLISIFLFFALTSRLLYQKNYNAFIKETLKRLEAVKNGDENFPDLATDSPVSGIVKEFQNLQYNNGKQSTELDFLRQAFEKVKFGLILFKDIDHPVLLNMSAAKMLDIKLQKGIGSTLLSHNTQIKDLADTALSGKQVKAKLELPYNMRSIEAQAFPLLENDEVIGCLVSLQDTTKLDTLADVKKDFIANVSHDLRTPIASIKSLTEALLAGAKDNPITLNNFLKDLDMQSERLSSLARDILDLSKTEKLRRLDLKKLSLAPLLEKSVNSFSSQAENKNLNVSLEIKDNTQAKVDPEQLIKAFDNLIDNSIKYTPHNGNINISLTRDNGYIQISFRDTGVGIAQREQPRIFERFYRISKSRSKKSGGTGLGLSIVKHVVENHNGKVKVKSQLNKGSEFTISIPSKIN